MPKYAKDFCFALAYVVSLFLFFGCDDEGLWGGVILMCEFGEFW